MCHTAQPGFSFPARRAPTASCTTVCARPHSHVAASPASPAPESHPNPAVPQMNAWRQIADMSDARAYGSSASLGSTVFAVGGLQSDMQVGCLCLCAGEAFGREGGLFGWATGCTMQPVGPTHAAAGARRITFSNWASTLPHLYFCHILQTHAILIECYNPVVDAWEHVELPANANPRRSFLAACGIE